MKIKYFFIYIIMISFLWPICCFASDATSGTDIHKQKSELSQVDNKYPAAVVVDPVFKAQPVIEGNDIVHTFVIKNTGRETLNISRVKTG
jgi:hypothetical protein